MSSINHETTQTHKVSNWVKVVKKHTQGISVQIPGQILSKLYSRSYCLISACLAGVKCRYDGSALPVRSIVISLRGKSLLLVCPEKLGGLSIPHPPAQIVPNNPQIQRRCNGGDVWKNRARVLTRNGKDLTRFFKKGARQVKDLVQLLNIKSAYLKSRSPSCGCGRVYNRHPLTKKAVLVKGDGVLTVLLKECGVRVVPID